MQLSFYKTEGPVSYKDTDKQYEVGSACRTQIITLNIFILWCIVL